MKNLMQALVCGIAPAPRSRAAPQALLLDALCLLLDILTPRLRPVSACAGGGAARWALRSGLRLSPHCR